MLSLYALNIVVIGHQNLHGATVLQLLLCFLGVWLRDICSFFGGVAVGWHRCGRSSFVGKAKEMHRTNNINNNNRMENTYQCSRRIGRIDLYNNTQQALMENVYLLTFFLFFFFPLTISLFLSYFAPCKCIHLERRVLYYSLYRLHCHLLDIRLEWYRYHSFTL